MAPGIRLLMVDDDVNLVEIFRHVCHAKGYEFHAAHSAAEGLRRILEVEPDVIVLDVIMEDFVAGFRVVSELRTGGAESPYARFARVPIVMLTSVTTKTQLDFSERVGTPLLPVDAFVEKPAKPGELIEAIEAVLARRAATDRGPDAQV